MSLLQTVTYDSPGSPRITLTRDATHGFFAVLEVSGLAPTRGPSAEERFAGIESLDPPMVRVQAQATMRETYRTLIAAAKRAVSSSATSTTGTTGGPRGIILTHMRVAFAMRAALRALTNPTEDI